MENYDVTVSRYSYPNDVYDVVIGEQKKLIVSVDFRCNHLTPWTI